MKSLGLALVVAVSVISAACGDNGSTPDAAVIHDGPVTPPIDAAVITPTFTTFVIDQIKNHTSSTTTPVPFAMFSTLADPDLTTNNVHAYDSLFM